MKIFIVFFELFSQMVFNWLRRARPYEISQEIKIKTNVHVWYAQIWHVMMRKKTTLILLVVSIYVAITMFQTLSGFHILTESVLTIGTNHCSHFIDIIVPIHCSHFIGRKLGNKNQSFTSKIISLVIGRDGFWYESSDYKVYVLNNFTTFPFMCSHVPETLANSFIYLITLIFRWDFYFNHTE